MKARYFRSTQESASLEEEPQAMTASVGTLQQAQHNAHVENSDFRLSETLAESSNEEEQKDGATPEDPFMFKQPSTARGSALASHRDICEQRAPIPPASATGISMATEALLSGRLKSPSDMNNQQTFLNSFLTQRSNQ